jgi:hypothetical protein
MIKDLKAKSWFNFTVGSQKFTVGDSKALDSVSWRFFQHIDCQFGGLIKVLNKHNLTCNLVCELTFEIAPQQLNGIKLARVRLNEKGDEWLQYCSPRTDWVVCPVVIEHQPRFLRSISDLICDQLKKLDKILFVGGLCNNKDWLFQACTDCAEHCQADATGMQRNF